MANDIVLDDTTPRYTRQDVDSCAFSQWYPKLEHVSIKSVIIPLPHDFTTLLLADGVKVPDIEPVENEIEDVIHKVQRQITATIKRFHGRVFPKLNWSAPQDASWMLGSLQCTTFEDVFLLLKASDFIVHDLTQPYAGCMDVNHQSILNASPTLVLKKWCNLYPSMIFRCFIMDHTKLIAISQRHCEEFYPFLVQQQDELCQRIYSFIHTLFFQRSEYIVPQSDYIVDLYVDKQHRIYIVDINVFGPVTDPLLFTWKELKLLRDACHDEDQVVDFRIVESSCGIRSHPLSSYRVPTDLVDHLAGGAGFDAFMDQVQRDNANNDQSDSDHDGETEEDDDDNVVWGSDDERYE